MNTVLIYTGKIWNFSFIRGITISLKKLLLCVTSFYIWML